MLKEPRKLLKIIKIVIWLLPIILFLWIFNKHFVLNGKLEIRYQVNKENKLIRNFASKEPDKLIGTKNNLTEKDKKDYFQLITTSPIYFDVKVPRPFQKATVTLKYQNPNNQPDIKLGIKQANGGFYQTDMAFSHPVLESLPEYWDKIQEGDLILWQKNKQYLEAEEAKQKEFEGKKQELDQWQTDELNKLDDKYKEILIDNNESDNTAIKDSANNNLAKSEEYNSKKELITEDYQKKLEQITQENKVAERPKPEFSTIAEFLVNLPQNNKVVQFNYDLSNYFKNPDYQKSSQTIEINSSLRGKHEIYTYIGQNEDLNFTFTIQDINRHQDEDVFKVSVYNNKNQKVKELSLTDDGENQASGKIYLERKLQILMEKIPVGIYHLLIKTTDDVFIKNIVTFQKLLMFKGNLYLTDNEEYGAILGDKELKPTTIFTNSSFIKTSTSHNQGLQKLKIKKETGEINYIKIKEKNVPNEFIGLSEITEITSPQNDVYLEGDGFFAFTEDQLFDLVTDLDKVTNIEDYDYIVANYFQAKQAGEWLTAEATITAPNLYFHQNEDLTASFILSLPGLPENQRVLKIKEVDIQFNKEPITINNFFPKLKNWLSCNLKKLK